MTEKQTETAEVIINPWKRESLSLTRQAEILKTDPKLAAQLQAAAARAAEEAEAAKRNAPEPEPTPKSWPINTRKKKPRPRRCI